MGRIKLHTAINGGTHNEKRDREKRELRKEAFTGVKELREPLADHPLRCGEEDCGRIEQVQGRREPQKRGFLPLRCQEHSSDSIE